LNALKKSKKWLAFVIQLPLSSFYKHLGCKHHFAQDTRLQKSNGMIFIIKKTSSNLSP
jgi:hypothetical protein